MFSFLRPCPGRPLRGLPRRAFRVGEGNAALSVAPFSPVRKVRHTQSGFITKIYRIFFSSPTFRSDCRRQNETADGSGTLAEWGRKARAVRARNARYTRPECPSCGPKPTRNSVPRKFHALEL